MKKILFALSLIFLTLFSCKETKTLGISSSKTKTYEDYINKQKLTGKEYILRLFDKNDIVIICERAHPEITQYDLFLDIISDPEFIKKAGTVCTETGSISLHDKTQKFLRTKFDSDEERYKSVLNISRNLNHHELWEKYNYTNFLLQLNKLNEKLADEKKINLNMIDVPFSWDTIKTPEDYERFKKQTLYIRDSIMANNIMNVYEKIKNKKRHKMLVILNYRHAFGPFKYADGSKPDNTARYIFETYPAKTANVLMNSYSYIEENPELVFHKVNKGIWDLAFKKTSEKSIGFDFKGTPFGEDKFDMFPYRKTDLKYKDVFTGFCFYKPLEKHILSMGIPGIFNEDFKKEYRRRTKIRNPGMKISEKRMEILNENREVDYNSIQKYFEEISQ